MKVAEYLATHKLHRVILISLGLLVKSLTDAHGNVFWVKSCAAS